MPDWLKLVCKRLDGLALGPAEKEEVHAELAAHLEESYEVLLKEGVQEQTAVQRVLSQVPNWGDLRRRIDLARSRKDTMTNRVTQLWLPGLITFVLSTGIVTLLQIFGPKPLILAMRSSLPVGVLYIPWVLLLPLVGALGAYLSWRAGGSKRAILLSILFPVLPFLASILIVLPVSLILDRFIAHSIAPMSLVMALLGWVLVPGVALLAGGLLAQFFLPRRVSSHGFPSQ